ncbi:MAG: GAF domain-containing protein [Candidatus Delongbacteria bacterium]|nr:GAF domain-containing protein [Candidatus Delongbacteria bacterium]
MIHVICTASYYRQTETIREAFSTLQFSELDPGLLEQLPPTTILLLDEQFLQEDGTTLRDALANTTTDLSLLVVYAGKLETINRVDPELERLFFQSAEPLAPPLLEKLLRQALNILSSHQPQPEFFKALQLYRRELQTVNEVGRALSAELDIDRLLSRILTETRGITRADSGSIYVSTRVDGEQKLQFKTAQNDSLEMDLEEFSLPFDRTSLAGYVAVTGEILNYPDVYRIPESAPFRFNYEVADGKSGYRSKSMLLVPMRNHHQEIIGVVQLINAKLSNDSRLKTPEDFEREVCRFTERHEEFVSSLASQAAVALENSQLYENIEALFEGFVVAAVKAIESRDPCTSGHSQRVSQLSLALAEAVTASAEEPFTSISFTAEQLKELKYATLLHDFGKVGVREKVLEKADKLYPDQFLTIQMRFGLAFAALEARFHCSEAASLLRDAGDSAALMTLREQYESVRKQYEEYWEVVQTANRPSPLPQEAPEQLQQMTRMTIQLPDNTEEQLLTEEECEILSIPRGTLTEEDRVQIESHVTHTQEFLQRIPWLKGLRRLTLIASAHHEKLDGTGYPSGLPAGQIPLESRIIAVADIYDALTASDRPYKPAVSTEKALKILGWEAEAGKIDNDLLQLFTEQEVYRILDETTATEE